MPFPPWLYIHVINHQFIVISYKSLPGYEDRLSERKQKLSKWLFIVVPSIPGAEALQMGMETRGSFPRLEFYMMFLHYLFKIINECIC